MIFKTPRDLQKIFQFLEHSRNLKSTPRALYTKTGRRESVAEHVYNLIVMIYVAQKTLKLKNIDLLRAIEIALFHDLAETITGDIPAYKKVNKEEKTKEERKAFEKLEKLLPNKIGTKVKKLWEEYEAARTQEAKLVKALDKMEGLWQIMEQKKFKYPEVARTYGDKDFARVPEIAPWVKKTKLTLGKKLKNKKK